MGEMPKKNGSNMIYAIKEFPPQYESAFSEELYGSGIIKKRLSAIGLPERQRIASVP
jgi:hypothetical protein